MANFGLHLHDASSSCLTSINKLMYRKTVGSPKETYPESVTEISAMIAQARRDSSPECDSCSRAGPDRPTPCRTYSNNDNNNPPGEPAKSPSTSRGVFKNVHTCGSIYAKCQCKHEESGKDSPSFSSSSTLSQNSLLSAVEDDDFFYNSFAQKRSSNPAISSSDFYAKLGDKRLSNPEVVVKPLQPHNHVCLKQKSPKSQNKTIIKANVYLNHPEINFPIPVELSREEPSTNNLHPELKTCLDYHKATALAHESQHKNNNNNNNQNSKKEQEAEKFLQDFGILAPSMGNGIVSSLRRSPRSSVDNNAVNQVRRNSKNFEGSINNTKAQQEEHLKAIIIKLKKEIQDMEVKYLSTQTELYETRSLLSCKENELMRLQREVHKLKSVLQQTTPLHQDEDILTSIQEQHAMANRIPQNQQPVSSSSSVAKKQGVSAESSEAAGQAAPVTKHDKDFRSKQLIKDAIMDNDFLKHLDTSQVREIVDSMEPKGFPAGSYVLRQGQAGVHLFVSAEGDFEIIQDGKVLGHMGPGKAFGELAILYNCTRTASIRAVTDSKVWMLDRKVFQQIMKRTGLQRLQDNISFLKSVPLLQKLSNDVLAKIADVLEVEFYPAGAYIIRQGASGDTFFIISSGSVKVTQRLPGHLEEDEIRVLQRGDYFGEQALIKEDFRTASVIALHPGVECLTLDRDSFNQLIGDLSEIKEKDYGDEQRLSRPVNVVEQQEYDYIELDDLDVVATLGIGGFGRVELVQYVKNPSLTFALKCLKKQHIVDTQQQDHIYSEKNIMMSCRSPFICRLYRTYRDSKYVYMLLEACLGGEVWTILRDRGCFDDHTTRFITACVVEAFDYLHTRGIIYRDLKPENLLLDSHGYVKLVDFGFSKRLGYSSKTWTFCGTPEYVAPETILNKGHDRAVDYWALGILMHELLTGNPPFTASDPMKTYNLILKGIDMIDFAKHNIGRSAQSLIKKLCRDSPSERLGYQRGGVQDIKKHKWFQGFDWDGLISRTLPAPIKQPVRGPCDTSNFDGFGKDNDIPPDECSDWDLNF